MVLALFSQIIDTSLPSIKNNPSVLSHDYPINVDFDKFSNPLTILVLLLSHHYPINYYPMSK